MKDDQVCLFLYFAKYPVTNKRYRSFISYLAGKKTEMTDSPPLKEFQEQLLRVASNIKDFSQYIGNDPEKWSVKFRSEYEEEKRFKGDDQPVRGVSWYEAKSYCLWLSLMAARESKLEFKEATGLFRLPTELEWEWAAAGRGSDGNLREYPWPVNKGEPSDKLTNYDDNVGAAIPVGRYPDGASPEDLHDMAGNVWEWMENHYKVDKHWPALRGGSWYDSAVNLRCSARDLNDPGLRVYDFGFRVVRAQT